MKYHLLPSAIILKTTRDFQIANRGNQQPTSSRVVPPKRYNQVRDRIVMNNLDSNQRHKEPSEEEKYPKKNLQPDAHSYVDLPSNDTSRGDLVRQLNQQQRAMQYQSPVNRASDIPQILVSSQPKALGHQAQLGMDN